MSLSVTMVLSALSIRSWRHGVYSAWWFILFCFVSSMVTRHYSLCPWMKRLIRYPETPVFEAKPLQREGFIPSGNVSKSLQIAGGHESPPLRRTRNTPFPDEHRLVYGWTDQGFLIERH
jgi:hypothetical protein